MNTPAASCGGVHLKQRKLIIYAWLEELNGHITVARLPAYAPELNPAEAIWAYLKKHEITNLRLKFIQRRPAPLSANRQSCLS